MLVEPPTGLRQGQATAGAIEQANAKFLLQRAKAAAELRRLYTEAAGRCREAPVLDDFREEPKIIEVSDLVHRLLKVGPSTFYHSQCCFAIQDMCEPSSWI